MQFNLNQIIEQVGREKGVDKEVLISALEEAMAQAARKKLGVREGIEARYNPEAGEIEVVQYKKVVEKVRDPDTELSLEEAREMDPTAQVGEFWA